MSDIDCLVIGAGVVGLAVARELALAGREVVIAEAAEGIGTQTSARNSEVIHAGIYYPPGSLKARVCVAGREKLYRYLQERGLPHKACGKLIVATSEAQKPALETIMARAKASGVDTLRWLSGAEARAMEPEVRCEIALISPETGVVDSHALMLSLLGECEAAGGSLALNTPITGWRREADGFSVDFGGDDPATYSVRTVVNSAGHGAPKLLGLLEGFQPEHVPVQHYAKGNYFALTGKQPFSHLVYPVPEAAGLGIHATIDMGGRVKFGPDVEWVEHDQDLVVDPARAEKFYAAIRTYWPALPDGALVADYAGIRPKLHGPSEPMPDFRIDGPEVHGVAELVNLLGIESPGLTSSLAIAEMVRETLS
ncbi:MULTISPECIES: NAD(P)/FAD-dependent oxidoreductase [Bosea]|uniref:NAD(P)/FAD-dependent oxidoreductase n=1 Tax=Bosea TaxID=85413 RepID=UPI00214F6E36|nr:MULTISPECIES: NAD(P)/FAD-dependent oxidoreductase [Bosea]MCR4521223.1 NAD(P)/FAD-dependent oxidoreductase [Bosea sp. 47.2.35]MDR6826647.1 L-2-hydroxyglutarate oxidase LhgO [Bosea robiniae]MDR6893357.1 L-2-hydroxyglutarate oxidase LhgO [Bosea sp. BE109]MDR7136944.1 L-2-hydroxyglutarate oxidase LhgO [Bosea sp. BE168]MDR7173643.1 L-2-hydroxyglutarate oxidase LhgO [Bosea sp. BE271]